MATARNANETLQALALAFVAEHRSSRDLREAWGDLFFSLKMVKEEVVKTKETEDGIITTKKVEMVGRFRQDPKAILRGLSRKYLNESLGEADFQELRRYTNALNSRGQYTERKEVPNAFRNAVLISESGFLQGDLTRYYFLLQGHPVFNVIKDTATKNVMNAMHTGLIDPNSDIINPIDIFAIERTSLPKIEKEFRQIADMNEGSVIETLLPRKTPHPLSITHLYHTYFHKKEMVGISLKMAKKINNISRVDVVGSRITKKVPPGVFQDSFTALITHLSSENGETIDRKIDKLIEILPITHDAFYGKVVNSRMMQAKLKFKTLNLGDSDSILNLYAWDGGNYNAQYDKSTGLNTAWTGGLSYNTAETFIRKYSGYGNIINEIRKVRKEGFLKAIYGNVTTRKPISVNNIKDTHLRTLYNSYYAKAIEAVESHRLNAKTAVLNILKFLQFVDDAHIRTHLFGYEVKDFDAPFFYCYYCIGQLYHTVKISNPIIMAPVHSVPLPAHLSSPKHVHTLPTVGKKISKNHYAPRSVELKLVKTIANVEGSYFFIRHDPQKLKKAIYLSIFGMIAKKGFILFKDGSGKGAIQQALSRIIRTEKKAETILLRPPPYLLLT